MVAEPQNSATAKRKPAQNETHAKVDKKQSPQKRNLPQKPEVGVTAKNEKHVTAKTKKQSPQNGLEHDDFFAGEDFAGAVEVDFAAGVDGDVWRVERRTYTKQDGTTMLYYNYRARKSYVKSGKRIVPYRKGGKRIL